MKKVDTLPRIADVLNEKLAAPQFAQLFDESLRELRFGLALCQLREELGVTQQELSERTRIPQSTISRIERGRIPEVPTLQKIATALNAQIKIMPDGQVTIEALGELPKAA